MDCWISGKNAVIPGITNTTREMMSLYAIAEAKTTTREMMSLNAIAEAHVEQHTMAVSLVEDTDTDADKA